MEECINAKKHCTQGRQALFHATFVTAVKIWVSWVKMQSELFNELVSVGCGQKVWQTLYNTLFCLFH